MNETIKKIISDKKTIACIFAGAVGVLLLVISSFSEKKAATPDVPVYDAEKIITAEDIELSMEKRLKKLIENINGIDHAEVMISIDSTGCNIYAENSKESKNNGSSSSEKEIILHEEKDGTETGLVVCIRSPEIRGVAIICNGGDNAVKRSEITKLVTNLFGIGADRVYVGSG